MEDNDKTHTKEYLRKLAEHNIIYDSTIFYKTAEDEDGEYRWNDSTQDYRHYPDWLGSVQSEEEFWETV